jgi:ATP-dependent RNA helicase RhlB
VPAPRKGAHAAPPAAPIPRLDLLAEEPASSYLTEIPFDSFDLPESVRKGIRDAGFVRTTPIQAKILPIALTGQDVAGQAQTGTGKTAAFLIATFTRLLKSERPRVVGSPRAFMLAPTRELVAQIEADAKLLGKHTGFRIHAVYGGVDYGRQREILREGVDILVGTPGRLIDYFKQKVYHLEGVEVLVIDEADRMFDMGFIPDLRFLLRRIPPFDRRQSMLFSATLSWRVMELAYEHMNLPQKVEVAPEQKTADNVTQKLYHVGNKEKLSLLLGLLRRDAGERVLVFVNTKVGAEAIVRRLEANGMKAAELSGDIPQHRRQKVLQDFKDGTLPILVATDVAARGLHIEAVTHVYNYDIPLDPEDYVHRIGRTARAGASGMAISFACERYVAGLEGIEKFIGAKIPVEWAEDDLYVHETRAPRGEPRRPELGRGGDRGAPRGAHGGAGLDRGHGGRGGHGANRPDRTDHVVRHHVTKEASLEAQLEAEGVVFEDALPVAGEENRPRERRDAPRPERRGEPGRREGGPRDRQRPRGERPPAERPRPATPPAEAAASDPATDAAFEKPPEPIVGTPPEGATAPIAPDGAPKRRRRRRRHGKKPGGATPGAEGSGSPEVGGDEGPDDGGDDAKPAAPGGFWDPKGL